MPNQKLGDVWGRQAARVTLVPHPLVVGTNQVGVEIELEGVDNAGRFRSDYWEVKNDGSLRNGHEFVFRGPTGGRDLHNALVEIDTFLNTRNPDGNWRCSTHVHVDVRDMNCKQLKNLIVAYAVLEKFLFKLSGIHRYKNNFCCALGFAQQQLKTLANGWNHESTYVFSNSVVQGWDKYSALNLLPITQFGSVEFRLSEAKWRRGKLLLLCNRFLAIKELAMSWEGTEEELIEHIINSDIRDILPKGLGKTIHEDYRDDLMVGYKLAYDLVVFAKNHPPVQFGARNDQDLATEIWEEIANRGPTIPHSLYVESDSPAVDISRGTWEQIIINFRAREIYLSRDMADQMNFASLRYVLNIGNWGPNVLIESREVRDMYNAWCEQNPLDPIRPRQAGPRGQRVRMDGWRVDAAMERAFNQAQALRARVHEEGDVAQEDEDLF